jgi:hypothetical protein
VREVAVGDVRGRMVKVVELRRVRVSQASSSPETRDRKGELT